MIEYIVEYPDDLIAEGYVNECINVHERIVRCKDCKHSYYNGTVCHPPMLNGGFDGNPYLEIQPNGFCACGDPKEE